MKKPLPYLFLLPMLLLSSCGNAVTEESSLLSSSQEKESSSLETSSTEVSSSISSSSSMTSSSSMDPNYPTSLSGCKNGPKTQEYLDKGYSPLYQDLKFSKGFSVSKPFYGPGESPYHAAPLRLYPSLSEPIWSIAQWTSHFDILGNTEQDGYSLSSSKNDLCHTITSKGKTGVNGEYRPAKVIQVDSTNGEIYLECNTSVEYDSPRQNGEGWTHLLFGQDFNANLIQIASCESIMMEAEFKVEKFEDILGGAANPNLHAAQVVWYITLQNRNPSSKDYGKYIWFGIGLWDNRTSGQATGMYRAHDAGTDTLIYNPASKDFYASKAQPRLGEEANAKLDVVAFAREAFDYAKANGYLGTTEYEDLYIGGTNFGFEVPGTYNIGTTFYSINVYYKKK